MKRPDGPLPIDWAALRARTEALSAALERKVAPSKHEVEELLAARARELAKAVDWRTAPPVAKPVTAVAFELGHERYALAAEHVLEVVPITAVTRVADSASHLLGILNVRGRLCAALHLGAVLGLPQRGVADLRHALVLAPRGVAAFAVELALEATELPHSLVQGPPGRDYVKGLATDGQLTVLDGDALLRDPRVLEAFGAGPGGG